MFFHCLHFEIPPLQSYKYGFGQKDPGINRQVTKSDKKFRISQELDSKS